MQQKIARPEMIEGQYYVYLLACADNSLYCGSTKNLEKRLQQHMAGEGAQWTKLRHPIRLVYFETHNLMLTARRREKQIKGWTITKKMNLVNEVWKKLNNNQ
jgi:putative endonuclease